MAEILWTGGPLLDHAAGVFPMGTDSVLLADFARPGPRDRILDLGAGSGILSILLSAERPEVRVTAVENSPEACALARHNIDMNGLADRIQLLEADLRGRCVPAGFYDLAISNPPYFKQDSGYVADGSLGRARSDSSCTLEELCDAAGWAVRWGGSFCLVFRPERLCDLISALRKAGFEPKRMRPVHHAPNMPVNLLLIEARRGGKPGLSWENDLFLFTPDGQESPESRRIYRR